VGSGVNFEQLFNWSGLRAVRMLDNEDIVIFEYLNDSWQVVAEYSQTTPTARLILELFFRGQ
jgi:hypothetical protein